MAAPDTNQHITGSQAPCWLLLFITFDQRHLQQFIKEDVFWFSQDVNFLSDVRQEELHSAKTDIIKENIEEERNDTEGKMVIS